METGPFQDYPDALLGLIEAVRLRGARKEDDSVWDLAEVAVEDFEPQLDALALDAWSRRREIEEDLGRLLSPPLSALDSMVGIVESVGYLLRHDELLPARPPEVVRYTTAMLLTRATSVANEVLALVRAGFPVGARARWRTLYELDVVAAVLLRGNRGTAARYVNHRWVIVAERHEEFFADDDEWALASPEVTRTARRLLKRYGPTYKSTYGWAAELTRRRLGVEKPQWRHLVRLADLDGHDRHVAYANRAVHADAIGGLLTLDASTGLFHSGARHNGIAGACLATVRVLGEILDSLIRTWARYGAAPDLPVVLALCEEFSLILQRQCLETSVDRPEFDQPDLPDSD